MGKLPEIVQVLSRKGDRLQLMGRSSFLFGWHEVHLGQLQSRSDWRDQIPTLTFEDF